MATSTYRHRPCTPSILLLGVPPSALCGIDLLSFTPSPNFHGIKDLPPGFHFIFSSETSSLSLRDGFWLHVPDTTSTPEVPLLVRNWNAEKGCLTPVTDPENYRGTLKELYEKGLSPYRQSADKESVAGPGDWARLTQHITPGTLDHLTQNKEWSLTSASCAQVDQEHIPGLNDEEMGCKERELGVLGIDLRRTWPEGAVGRERTDGALDRSWALADVAKKWQGSEGDWGDVMLGQMEACFLMVLTLANYSCLEEWKRCLGLVLTCKKAVREHEQFFATFLAVLEKQIRRCEDVDGGLFDMGDGAGLLKRWLKCFQRAIERMFVRDQGGEVKEGFSSLEKTLKSMFGWELSENFVRKGTLQLEDGETVEMDVNDMDEEDESGEYAPAVVNLENGPFAQ